MSVQYIEAKLKDRTGSRVTACHVATVVICMHVMQTVWNWQMWLRACEAQCGPGTCAVRRELQSVSISALRRAQPQSYTQSPHHRSTPKTQSNILSRVFTGSPGNSSCTFHPFAYPSPCSWDCFVFSSGHPWQLLTNLLCHIESPDSKWFFWASCCNGKCIVSSHI